MLSMSLQVSCRSIWSRKRTWLNGWGVILIRVASQTCHVTNKVSHATFSSCHPIIARSFTWVYDELIRVGHTNSNGYRNVPCTWHPCMWNMNVLRFAGTVHALWPPCVYHHPVRCCDMNCLLHDGLDWILLNFMLPHPRQENNKGQQLGINMLWQWRNDGLCLSAMARSPWNVASVLFRKGEGSRSLALLCTGVNQVVIKRSFWVKCRFGIWTLL